MRNFTRPEKRQVPMEETEDQRSGTQTIERAVVLLREISTRGHVGWPLSDLAARCGLHKSTAHRILTCLIRERLVRQREGDRHYIPGPLLFELGLSSLPERGELQHAARSRLATLAKQTSGVGFLFFRSGDDFVCALRVGMARCAVKDLTIFPGTRRPLAVAAGGVAILLALPKAEARAIIRRNLADLTGYDDASVRGIRRMLERSFAEGFALNAADIRPEVHAFGLALCDPAGVPFASLSLAGSPRTFPLDKIDEYRRLVQAAADGLQPASILH